MKRILIAFLFFTMACRKSNVQFQNKFVDKAIDTYGKLIPYHDIIGGLGSYYTQTGLSSIVYDENTDLYFVVSNAPNFNIYCTQYLPK